MLLRVTACRLNNRRIMICGYKRNARARKSGMLTSQAESLSRSVELNSAGRTGVAARDLLRLPVVRAVNAAILARARWYRMFSLLSKTHTRLVATLLRFPPGVTLVWLIDPKRRTARVFSAVERSMLLRADQALDGGDVLPGFVLRRSELLNRGRRPRRV
jgi:hypothetical protein